MVWYSGKENNQRIQLPWDGWCCCRGGSGMPIIDGICTHNLPPALANRGWASNVAASADQMFSASTDDELRPVRLWIELPVLVEACSDSAEHRPPRALGEQNCAHNL